MHPPPKNKKNNPVAPKLAHCWPQVKREETQRHGYFHTDSATVCTTPVPVRFGEVGVRTHHGRRLSMVTSQIPGPSRGVLAGLPHTTALGFQTGHPLEGPGRFI